MSSCSKQNREQSFEEQLNQKKNVAKVLLEKYDAEMFNCSEDILLNKPIVMDSIVLGIKNEGNDYYLRARIKSGCSKKYFAELKCSKEIADKFSHSKSSAAYLAAEINKISYSDVTAETDSLDGSVSVFHIGDACLLTGDCLAYAEIPPFFNAN